MAENYAALHKQELADAIESAPDHQTLDAIDEDLAREGWTPDGVMRARIAERHQQFDAPPAPAV